MNQFKLLLLISVLVISSCSDDTELKKPEPVVQFYLTDITPDATYVSFTAWAETENVDLEGERGFVYKLKSTEELTLDNGEILLQPLLSDEDTVFGLTNDLEPESEYDLRAFMKDGTTGEIFYSDVVTFTTLKLVELTFEITEVTSHGMTATGTMINRGPDQGLDQVALKFLYNRILPTPLYGEVYIEDVTWDEYRTYTFFFTYENLFSSGAQYMITPVAEINDLQYSGTAKTINTP